MIMNRYKLFFILWFLFSIPCFAQNKDLNINVSYNQSSQELVFLFHNEYQEEITINNVFNVPNMGSRFTLIMGENEKKVSIGDFHFRQDGQEWCSKILLSPNEKITCSYKLVDLLMHDNLCNVTQIQVNILILYFAGKNTNMKSVYLTKVLKIE